RSSSAARSSGMPSSRAHIMAIRSSGRGRLPTCVVRKRPCVAIGAKEYSIGAHDSRLPYRPRRGDLIAGEGLTTERVCMRLSPLDRDPLPGRPLALRRTVRLQRGESFPELCGYTRVLRVQARSDAWGERDHLGVVAERGGLEQHRRLPTGGRAGEYPPFSTARRL